MIFGSAALVLYDTHRGDRFQDWVLCVGTLIGAIAAGLVSINTGGLSPLKDIPFAIAASILTSVILHRLFGSRF
jgi:hypothetical protein